MGSLRCTHKHLAHNGGTKDYDIWIISNQFTNRAILVRRWGKVGATGQTKINDFVHINQASKYADKIIKDKTSPASGYQIEHPYADTNDVDSAYVKRVMPTHVFSCVTPQKWAWIGAEFDDKPAPAPTAQKITTDDMPAKAMPVHYGTW